MMKTLLVLRWEFCVVFGIEKTGRVPTASVLFCSCFFLWLASVRVFSHGAHERAFQRLSLVD